MHRARAGRSAARAGVRNRRQRVGATHRRPPRWSLPRPPQSGPRQHRPACSRPGACQGLAPRCVPKWLQGWLGGLDWWPVQPRCLWRLPAALPQAPSVSKKHMHAPDGMAGAGSVPRKRAQQPAPPPSPQQPHLLRAASMSASAKRSPLSAAVSGRGAEGGPPAGRSCTYSRWSLQGRRGEPSITVKQLTRCTQHTGMLRSTSQGAGSSPAGAAPDGKLRAGPRCCRCALSEQLFKACPETLLLTSSLRFEAFDWKPHPKLEKYAAPWPST